MTEAELRGEIETLQERIIQLEEVIGLRFDSPLMLGLTPSEAKLFGALLKREFLTREALLICLYGSVPSDDEVEIKIVDVFICKLRKKLRPFGIAIETMWGRGFYMTPAAKAAVDALVNGEPNGPGKISRV
jgi:two-component system, cell cycle response regulator CtrA